MRKTGYRSLQGKFFDQELYIICLIVYLCAFPKFFHVCFLAVICWSRRFTSSGLRFWLAFFARGSQAIKARGDLFSAFKILQKYLQPMALLVWAMGI